jgi:hypothetical protein
VFFRCNNATQATEVLAAILFGSHRKPRDVSRRHLDDCLQGLAEKLLQRRDRDAVRPQPVADFGCAADRIQDLGANTVAPRQVAAFRLGVQSAEIAGHSNQLGTIATEPFRYETCGSHLD